MVWANGEEGMREEEVCQKRGDAIPPRCQEGGNANGRAGMLRAEGRRVETATSEAVVVTVHRHGSWFDEKEQG